MMDYRSALEGRGESVFFFPSHKDAKEILSSIFGLLVYFFKILLLSVLFVTVHGVRISRSPTDQA